jgi:tetratricopeptide (TPR) repeat protein
VVQSEQEVLVERLGRYPVQRYPAQHATTQFHLGSLLLHAGELVPALHALTAAHDVFADAGMRLEQAKATVMLGVALRTVGRRDEAVAAFTTAGTALAALDQPAEQAAAAYNLGLVRQDGGELEDAAAAWSSARELFLAAGYPAQAGAAARDHGGSLLARGKVADALPLLEQALTLAEQAGDEPGAGAAANALGLAQLAAQDPAAAVTALRRGLGFFPRTVRPADHAMVKANLALAHEQARDPTRARLAAAQALTVSSAAAPVRAQAQAVLGRLPGRADEDLLTVLDTEDREQWVSVLREEVLRSVELPAAGRRELVRGFLDGVLARPGASYDLAEALLQVVLELPPRTYELLVSAVVSASAGRPEPDTERLHAVIGSALARFALPQWQRLAASLNAAAQATGQPATWR